ncbi:hypothetical protein [Carnobacterium jeotgali]|uniref:hypothetical protein n=1 Tax=Carnobacterium jeotgali TaxID=545534 RepID=UPI00388F113A
MSEKREFDQFTSSSKAKNRSRPNFFSTTAKIIIKKLAENKRKERELVTIQQQETVDKLVIDASYKEKEILQQAKQEAEDILTVTFQQSEKLYQEVKQNIEMVKEEVELKKRLSFEHFDKERTEAQKLTKKAEEDVSEMVALANKKTEQVEEELSLKKAVYQQEIDRELGKLVKEKEWFEQYQQQVQESIERKEKELFFESRKKIEQEQIEKASLQNKVDYLKALNTKRKMNSYRIGLVIFGCTVVMSLLLTLFRYSTPIVNFIGICLAFIIACLAFVLVYINLVDGKTEQKIKGIGFQNASLIEKNQMLVETIVSLEKDIKKLIEEKIQLERTKRHSQDNSEFLKIMQADLKHSEMHRRVLESENTALRKHLVSEEIKN